jgi:hypothetical protein
MDDSKYKEIAEIYLSIVRKSRMNLSSVEENIIKKSLEQHGYEKTKEILDVFKEEYNKQKPKNPSSLLLRIVDNPEQEKPNQEPVEKNEQGIQNQAKLDYESELDVIVGKYNVEPDKDILNVLDYNLKKYYISELIYQKIWQNLTDEEKKQYKQKALSYIRTLNISDKDKLKEALDYRIKYLIKKDFNILY